MTTLNIDISQEYHLISDNGMVETPVFVSVVSALMFDNGMFGNPMRVNCYPFRRLHDFKFDNGMAGTPLSISATKSLIMEWRVLRYPFRRFQV